MTTSCYFIHHTFYKRPITAIISEIEQINPDKIFILCLEEYDYINIFKEVFEHLQPYLEKTNKYANLIVPYIDPTPLPPNFTVEDCYGSHHWHVGLIDGVSKEGQIFKFTSDTKLFTSYNNNAKYHRSMLVDELAKHGLLHRGIVTLNNPMSSLPDGTPFVFKYHSGEKLKDEPDFLLNSKPEYAAGSLPLNYLKGFIDIASESTFEKGQFFTTEKTAKPLATLKPFLVLGPPNYHKHLKDRYGIEYYDEMFDYDFDRHEDPIMRITGIVQNIDRLKTLTNIELMVLHKRISPKLISNRDNFVSVRNKDDFFPKSLRFLMTDKDVQLYGDLQDAAILRVMEIIR